MGKQDVRQALIAMDGDESVRERLAAGDFGAVEGLDLSAEEQTLVQDAANDMPEVAGFASDIFAKLGDIKGESLDDKHKDEIEIMSFNFGDSYMKWQTALKYTLKY
jgi:Type VI secretion system effector, Hcp